MAVKVTFRRVVVVERTFHDLDAKAVRQMIAQYGAHELALDGNPVSDDTKTIRITTLGGAS